MRIVEAGDLNGGYDLVVVGTGFGSLFFVKKFLEKRRRARVLMLEWGANHTHEWQIEQNKNADLSDSNTLDNRSGKPWLFTVGIGGGTNCWWGLSPRLHPSDFKLKTLYGVGEDWPISYDDLANYYSEAERTILVSGPDDLSTHYPHTPRYPQPAHNMSSADRLLKAAMPDQHYSIPSGRLRHAVGARAACCSTATCNLCPGNSKMTAHNTLMGVLSDPRVDIVLGAKVDRLDKEAGVVKSAHFTSGEQEYSATGDLFVLGANAIYSPWILLRSGIGGHGVGKYLCEKMFVTVEVYLNGLKHFDGGTGTTCFNLSLLDGEHRREHGAAAILIENRMAYGLRPDFGRWREVMPVSAYIEDIPQEQHGISVGDGPFAVVEPFAWSDYAERGKAAFLEKLPEVLSALPVERIEYRDTSSASHIQCTTRMGTSAENSVVDGDLIHHELRNLIVVGNSTFPTVGSVNPSLTTAALSLRAADRLTRSA